MDGQETCGAVSAFSFTWGASILIRICQNPAWILVSGCIFVSPSRFWHISCYEKMDGVIGR